jgi:uncharacterized protein (TIGR02598 family)
MNPSFATRHGRCLKRGFSLVEVTLAVAIAALAVTTLLALIPHSISTIRKAGITTLEARIVAQVVGELQLADWGTHDGGTPPGKWSNFEQLLAQKWLFDDQGNMLDAKRSEDIQMRLTSVVRPRVSPSSVVLPGGTVQSVENVGLMVDIAASADPDFPFTVDGSFRTIPAILTRQFAR